MFGTASQKVRKMNLTDGDESKEESYNHLAIEVRALLATSFGTSDSNILQCGTHIKSTNVRLTFACFHLLIVTKIFGCTVNPA